MKKKHYVEIKQENNIHLYINKRFPGAENDNTADYFVKFNSRLPVNNK